MEVRTTAGFSVDTHLLRELGELLVGRESTALLELIKNSYDADASHVTVEALGLGRPDAILRIIDDGNGMSRERFESAFLRIAGRGKEGEDRRSPLYHRRYTGQKGIGRLAAHKLAARLNVTSIPRELAVRRNNDVDSLVGVRSAIDWDVIERQSDLDNLTAGLDVASVAVRVGVPYGTTIELRKLRASWNDRQLTTFVTELRSAQPPSALADPNWPGLELASTTLIKRPIIRDVRSSDDPGFEVRLTGDLEIGESLWRKASQDFEWLIEIDATSEIVRYQITPMRHYAESEPEAKTYYFQRRMPVAGRPRFQCRILTMPNASTRRGPLSGFVRSMSGVRVYLEGFRILPYGEYGDDWLGIDRDYRTGPRFYTIDIDSEASDRLEADRKEGLHATGNTGYFGAVFLTEDGAGGLRSLVNREGFVPDEKFDALVDLVQTGIRLSVRVRRSVFLRIEERKRRQVESEAASRVRMIVEPSRPGNVDSQNHTPPEAPGQPEGHGQGDRGVQGDNDSLGSRHLENGRGIPRNEYVDTRSTEALQGPQLSAESRRILSNAHEAVGVLRAATIPGLDIDLIETVIGGLEIVESELDRLREIQPELRILASVGLQLGAFVHDINGMLGQSRTLRELLDPLAADTTLTANQSRRVRRIIRAVDDLSHTLARQSSYLTDVLVADPRRRRSRVRVLERLNVVRRLLANEMSRMNVTIDDNLPEDLKTPPMFPAEVGILLTNLLTNAVKNAGSPGRVLVAGAPLGLRGVTILVHNTGVAVDLQESERWFQPFESTTVEVNDVLGQGLGLGLPITRALIEDYRGTIRFVEPPQGYATSVRVDLPDPQERR